jgi:hypothetical protein
MEIFSTQKILKVMGIAEINQPNPGREIRQGRKGDISSVPYMSANNCTIHLKLFFQLSMVAYAVGS